MPPHPHRPSELAWRVFRGSDVIRRGLLTRHQLRGASWLRLRHDVYADSRLDRDHTLACRAALLRMPPGALVAGPSAAYLHGVEHAAGFEDDVHVLLPPSARADAQPGIRIHRAGPALAPTHAYLLVVGTALGSTIGTAADRADNAGGHGEGSWPVPTSARPAAARPIRSEAPPATRRPGPVEAEPIQPGRSSGLARTGPAACAWETAVWADPVQAVGVIDALLGMGLVSRTALADVADRNGERPGGRRARWVFGLADPQAQSPPESHLRVRLMLAGLPRPVAQHPVRLGSGLVLHPGLAWPEFRVAVEYHGLRHVDPGQPHRDRERLTQFVGAGWLVLHVTSRRLHRDFAAVVREARAALVSRGWQP
ncbi:hypothetical protein [Micromonospora sp. SL4-19]|uniref:hypothetical protein n=1 Tax=Micromonospora sp. SL4-19 TaxID=3399129 RepID=UPI003A4DE341